MVNDDEKSTFGIAALPRSRTAWLSAFFNQGEALSCTHEMMVEPGVGPSNILRTLLSRPTRVNGTAETCFSMFPDSLCDVDRIICVIRPIRQIYDSLKLLGLITCFHHLDMLQENLLAISHWNNCLTINFNDIDSKLYEIHKFIAPCEEYDERRAKLFTGFNIQITGHRWSELIKMGHRMEKDLHDAIQADVLARRHTYA